MAAWEKFLSGQQSADILRKAVDGSWQRCQVGKVDPESTSGPSPIPSGSLYMLRQSHRDLLALCEPVMAHARDFLSETGMFLALTDPQGTILSTEGDNRTRNDAERIHLMPGVTWSEMACGTNAIGTALALGQPVQIHSAEHYCQGIKHWTCSATLIRHPLDNDVLGVINISGLSRTFSRHNLGMVVTMAQRAENQLAAREMELRYMLLDATMEKLSAHSNDGLILFDHRGHPLKANRAALTALGHSEEAVNLSRVGRVRALSLDAGDEDGTPPLVGGMPCWIQPEWLQPVFHEGRRVGTLLVLPIARPITRAPAPEGNHGTIRAQSHAERGAFASLIGDSAQLKLAIDKAAHLAKSRVPILLTGETGVGKEEFAHGIHRAGPDHAGPFVALNCGGLSRELLLSELFGYVEGAFTGARRGGQCGKIEAANDGTLFLDEIGEMPLDLQPHLLRVLEQGEITRLGENHPRKVNFRLIAATHRDLRREAGEDRFRMDLFYRLAVTDIHIPCLRERPGDIRMLADHFLALGAEKHGLGHHSFSREIIEALEAYAWPGNVRELRNVVESMLLMSTAPVIESSALPPEIREAKRTGKDSPEADGEHSRLRITQVEREAIIDAIRTTSANLTAAAKLLGIAKSTLYLKIDKYALRDEIAALRRTYPG